MQARKKIPYMYAKNKDNICDPQGIADLFAEYYQDLYNINRSEIYLGQQKIQNQ